MSVDGSRASSHPRQARDPGRSEVRERRPPGRSGQAPGRARTHDLEPDCSPVRDRRSDSVDNAPADGVLDHGENLPPNRAGIPIRSRAAVLVTDQVAHHLVSSISSPRGRSIRHFTCERDTLTLTHSLLSPTKARWLWPSPTLIQSGGLISSDLSTHPAAASAVVAEAA